MQSLALISESNKLISQLYRIWDNQGVIVDIFDECFTIVSKKGRVYIRFLGNAEDYYEKNVVECINKVIFNKKYYYLIYYSSLEMLLYFITKSKLINELSLKNNNKKSNIWLDFSSHGY